MARPGARHPGIHAHRGTGGVVARRHRAGEPRSAPGRERPWRGPGEALDDRLGSRSGQARGDPEHGRCRGRGSDSVDATGRGETYTRTWTVGAGPTATCKTLTVAVAWNERGSHSVSLHSILEQ